MTTDSLLFQIQMSEHNSLLYVEKNYMTIFSSFSANFPPHYHTILAINCVHASNWFTHLQLMVSMTILFLLCGHQKSQWISLTGKVYYYHACLLYYPRSAVCILNSPVCMTCLVCWQWGNDVIPHSGQDVTAQYEQTMPVVKQNVLMLELAIYTRLHLHFQHWKF